MCVEAALYCSQYVAGAYGTKRSFFDVSHFNPDPQPPLYAAGFANRAWVQRELGAMVNFTWSSNLLLNRFLYATGDLARRAGLEDLKYLLDTGIKVTLIYGDSDYRCPWLGAEQLSLAAIWTGATAYGKAGYGKVRVNNSYVGGVPDLQSCCL